MNLAESVPLWEEQEELLDRTLAAMKQYRRVLVQAPTGSGKTRLITKIAHGAARTGKPVVIGVHLEELIDQIRAALWNFGIAHDVLAAGSPDPIENIYIASIPTLIHRLDRLPAPFFYFRDEAHHSVANTDMKVFEAFRSSLCAGMTATPTRLDGTGLNTIYEAIVLGKQILELIDLGRLVFPKLYAPEVEDLDLSKLRTLGGDFNSKDSIAACSKSKIVGDSVQHYGRLVPGKQAIGFYVSIEEAEKAAAKFIAAGIPAACVHSKLTKFERRNYFDLFKRKELNYLTNVALFLEGVDVPAIEAVIWCRPTKSTTAWMQGNGRAMRADEGKTHCTIIDCCGNWERPGLGHPAAYREWSLEGRKKLQTEGVPPCSRCPKCHYVGPPFRICPDCGEEREIKEREYKQVAGQLTLIDDEKLLAAKIKKEKHAELLSLIGGARNRADLEKIARDRGYDAGWVDVQWGMKRAKYAKRTKWA